MNAVEAMNHPARRSLNDEVHARPSDDLKTPCTLSYIAAGASQDSPGDPLLARLSALLAHHGQAAPDASTKHLKVNTPDHRLRWERHTEFARYAFIGANAGGGPFAAGPVEGIPAAWLAELESEVLSATQVSVLPMRAEDELELQKISDRYFSGNTLIGSRIAGGRAIALTDFRIPEDGFMRVLVLNHAMPETQTGRFVQRLLEIDTYRMMALLALPVAQALAPKLNDTEQELGAIYEALVERLPDEETELLERLSLQAASNQRRHARSDYRFAAADAYYELVLQRIRELREQRIPGVQTFDEFVNRRLTPAIKTCRAVAGRQQALVQRMSRATQLLSTRIDVDRQHQNQRLLESMNRRAESQLRLQATVEGLSVAAMTYYIVGLIGILAEALAERGAVLNPAVVAGISVPLVAGVAYYGIRRIRRRIAPEGRT